MENQWTGGNAYLCITGIPIGNVPFLCSLSTYQSLFVAISLFSYYSLLSNCSFFLRESTKSLLPPKKGGGKTFPFLTLKLIKAADLWHLHLTLFSWQSPKAAWQFLPLCLIQRVLEERIIHPQHLVFPKGIPPIAPCCALGIKEDQIELFTSQRPYHGLQALVYTTHT